ncbi:MAG: VOC family protein [Vulcanimicrobiaceae bacterium]
MSKFVWYDLMTGDYKAAEAFYHNVIGWDARDSGMPGTSYTLFSIGGSDVAGLMPPPGGGTDAPACWNGYIGVDDVDAYAARVTAADGSVHRAPEDIPGVGRFAVVADPHGAVFLLFTPAAGSQGSTLGPGTPGTIGWNELHAGDGPEAVKFYTELFGWTKTEALDMGEFGVYQTFAVDGVPTGGIMTKGTKEPGPYWLYYINVDAIDAAAERAANNGGSVQMGPQEVPGGQWMVHCLDPQGTLFAMLAAKR